MDAGRSSTPSTAFGHFSSSSPISYVSEPLDLSAISDRSTAVIFKGLSKAHENTKTKALEELLVLLEKETGEGDVEEGVLAAWIRLYPRLSVDLARRVRQLCHTVHASMWAPRKKRIRQYISQIIGPWVASLFDNDQTVVRAARESFLKIFSSDKLGKVWEAYHKDILEYAIKVIECEQVYSLSDERQTRKDDAEAKFARVIGACVFTIRHLLGRLSRGSRFGMGVLTVD